MLKEDFRLLQSRYKNYQQVYSEGSKKDSKVGCAVISGNHSNMQRIPDNSPIFTAEAKALEDWTLIPLPVHLESAEGYL